MADERIRMPSSGGGIIRYYEEYKSKVEIQPTYIIAAVIAVIVLIIVLHNIKPFI